ncbi:MAG: hemerythrin family protein [Gammaproteobacteria bacterium]|nr:hemerythrin family protein [Gammaproteobacteria bacterium]
MKELIWDNTLSVEVKEIDDDHRKLLELFNLLSRSVTTNDTNDYIEAVLEELISFTVWHFRHEERLMLKYSYPGMAEHKAEHHQLIESARTFQQKILIQGKTRSTDDIVFLEQWLTGHILGADMELGLYLGRVM